MVEYRARKDDLARAMDVSAQRIEESGARTAGKVAGSMRDMADNIRSFSLDKYKEQMMDAVDDARTEVDKNVENVKTNIRDHPLESVAIAAGTGIILGAFVALMSRRSARKEY